MKVIITEDKELFNEVLRKIKDNGGYCPCAIEKNDDTRCLCKSFREEINVGEYCHCGIYLKMED